MFSQHHQQRIDVIETIIEIATQAMGTPFEQVTDEERLVFPATVQSGSAISVVANLVADDQDMFVSFTLYEVGRPSTCIQGKVVNDESLWLERLVATTAKLIEKELLLYHQEDSLGDYASQISRDFEELVWTRDLADQIQHADISDPLTKLADQLFPVLIETVQAAQLTLVQYAKPISRFDQIPEAGLSHIQSYGDPIVDRAAIDRILTDFANKGRQRVVVNNHCAPLRIPHLSSFMLLPIQTRTDEFGWMLAVNRSAPTSDAIDSSENIRHNFHQPEFGTFEAGILQSTAVVMATHAKNTALHVEQEELLIGIVRALINAIDAKDHYTHGHSERVARMSRRIALQLRFSEQECEELYLAGLLHDIGKIGVPDEVLQKQGPLTDEEFDLLKQHPVIGHQVLQHLGQVAYVLPGVLHHHESFNGRGYPAGLAGEEIPLPARIISVADAFDAMTSDRPYRDGMPIAKAEGILRQNLGPQWDPIVLEAFFAASEDVYHICFQRMQGDQPEQSAQVLDFISQAVGITH